MRANAEVDERLPVLDRVDGDFRLSFSLLLDQLHLERLTLRGEELERFVTRPHLPLVDQVLAGELFHLLLDGREIFGNERAIDDEVVEEPFIGGRTDTALRARKERGDGRGEQVRRAVPVERQRLRIPVGDNRQARVVVQWMRQIDEPAIDGRRQRCFREPRRHECRYVTGSSARAHATAGSVG
jgi:hypothetical protein